MNHPKQSKQAKRFIEKARELGCDENEAAFDDRLRKIAKVAPQEAKKPSSRKKGG